MAELYSNLPGFTVEYKDRGLIVPQEIFETDKVVLIGTATDGPQYEPIQIQSPNADAEAIFGKAYNSSYQSNGTTLMLGAFEAYGAGARNIALVRVGGETATADLGAIELRGMYAGSLYNNVQYKVDLSIGEEVLVINRPNTKGGGSFTFPLEDLTVAALVDAINEHLDNNIVVASVVKEASSLAKEVLVSTPPYSSLITTFTAPDSNFKLTSKGSPGNDISLTLTKPGTDTSETSVSVVGKEIKVTLKTEAGAILATAEEVVNAINDYAGSKALVVAVTVGTGTGIVEAMTKTILTSEPVFVNLTDGADGPTASTQEAYISSMYRCLHEAYSLLEDYDSDIVVPLGVFADYELTVSNVTTNFGEQLANFCSSATERNYEVWGVISMSPISTITQKGIKTQVAELATKENMYYKLNVIVDEDAETDAGFVKNIERVKDMDTDRDKSVGHYISVIAMPEGGFTHPVVGNYFAPLTAAYAGFVSALPIESAPTNKIVPNIKRLRYRLSPAQLDLLTGKRFVTFKENNRSVLITDACTACEVNYDTAGRMTFRSDFWRLSTLRIVFHAVSEVRRVSEPFIGEPNNVEQQNALDTAIKSALNQMKPKALTDYRFSISATLQQKIDGDSSVTLELIPIFERRKIRVIVSLRAI